MPLQVEDGAPALGARGKREVHPLALRRDLDRDDLVEHLDPALDLRRLRRLVAEAVDERFHPGDFVVLLLLALAQLFHPRLALAQVGRVVADVVGQRAEADLRDARHDRVEEEAIVRHEDDGVRVLREILFEPVARLEIQVVGRFVEQEQARPAEQQLGERDAHLPAARKRLAGLVQILWGKAQAAQDGRDLQVDAVPLLAPERLLQLAVAREHRGVLGLGGRVVGQAFLERGDLGTHVEQRLEREPRFLEQRATGVAERPSCGR